ncbi:MAG: hypothetical protein HC890_13170 [Chloroflexaceae bacterium]|nr:hypothetical protein [Chloroflexaceae bacterium]
MSGKRSHAEGLSRLLHRAFFLTVRVIFLTVAEIFSEGEAFFSERRAILYNVLQIFSECQAFFSEGGAFFLAVAEIFSEGRVIFSNRQAIFWDGGDRKDKKRESSSICGQRGKSPGNSRRSLNRGKGEHKKYCDSI